MKGKHQGVFLLLSDEKQLSNSTQQLYTAVWDRKLLSWN